MTATDRVTANPSIVDAVRTDDELYSVYALYETASPADDYRAFAYLVRLQETLADEIAIQARILGRYRGPRLRRQAISAKEPWRQRQSPHLRGIGHLRRRVLSGFKFLPSYHWFSSIDGNLYAALSWMSSWNRPDSKVVLFAYGLDRGLKLVELVFLFARHIPSGIVLVLLEAGDLDPRKLIRLKRWGVTVLLDGAEVIPAQANPELELPVYEFSSSDEMPLMAEKYPRVFWDSILKPAVLKNRNPEKVLFFRPDWSKCGSATTFAKLSRLFNERDAILIDVALQPHRVFCDALNVKEKLADAEEVLSPAFHFNLRRSSLPVAAWKIAWYTLLRRPRTVAGYMAVFYLQCKIPSIAKRLIGKARIDYLYVNHYFSLPVAKQLRGDRPVFLDTHDVQSLNFISHDYHQQVNMRAAPFTKCLQEELAIVDTADRVTMVSRDEIELVNKYRPANYYSYYIPLPDVQASPSAPSISFPRGSGLNALIVASRNPANERSLTWFLKVVWPRVCHLPYKLTIVGTINRYFEGTSFPNVVFAGIVDDLQAYYQSADLVILPITNGGGIAIKTLEAIQAELPIVCTRHAMRGLPVEVQSLMPGSLTDHDLVDDLTQMALSRESLADRRDQTAMAHQALISINFDEKLHHELDMILQRSRQ
jgi:glycosyltransferase involved in cell wall biosynthesis